MAKEEDRNPNADPISLRAIAALTSALQAGIVPPERVPFLEQVLKTYLTELTAQPVRGTDSEEVI